MKDALGDRIKAYEDQETNARFLPNVPVVARIDGRCFSKLTKGMERPFDAGFAGAMQAVTMRLVKETGANIGYTQSDEISLCWYKPEINSEIFFAGRKFKMIGQLAAMATAYFHIEGTYHWGDEFIAQKAPTFDARVFQVPTLAEGANAFLWRQRDCRKNAISMVARSLYSHKALHGKNGRDMLEMIALKNVNYERDIDWRYREGVFIRKVIKAVALTPEELVGVPMSQRLSGNSVVRSSYERVDIALLSDLENAIDVIFFGAESKPKETHAIHQAG